MNQKKNSVRWHLETLKARRHIIDPPTCCGAATTILCGGRGDSHPLWRISLVEPGAKVTVIVFTEETWLPSSNILSECYNNVNVSVPLWLTEPRDKHPRREFAFSYPAL